jgi:hypothetical protein
MEHFVRMWTTPQLTVRKYQIILLNGPIGTRICKCKLKLSAECEERGLFLAMYPRFHSIDQPIRLAVYLIRLIDATVFSYNQAYTGLRAYTCFLKEDSRLVNVGLSITVR